MMIKCTTSAAAALLLCLLFLLGILHHSLSLEEQDTTAKIDVKTSRKRVTVRNELMEATFMAHVDRVYDLLQLDPEVLTSRPPVLVDRIEEDYGRTSLMVCGFDPQDTNRTKVDIDCSIIAKLLHQKGANLSAVDDNGWDALALGAVRGYSRYCKFLLKHNVSANHIDHEHRTALMKAAAHGHISVARVLKKYGADFTIQDNKGLTALHHATKLALANASYIPFLQKFVTLHDSVDINSLVDFDNRTTLMYAVISENIPIAKVLIDAGADPRLQDKYYVSTTSMSSNPELRNLLLEAVVNKTESEHRAWIETPIEWDKVEL